MTGAPPPTSTPPPRCSRSPGREDRRGRRRGGQQAAGRGHLGGDALGRLPGQAATVWDHGETGIPVAGPGAPLIAEFSVTEFAAAIGLPTEAGKAYLGEAVELRYRLPRVWSRVVKGDLPAWRARRVARATIALSVEAAAYVDLHVAHVTWATWRSKYAAACIEGPWSRGRPGGPASGQVALDQPGPDAAEAVAGFRQPRRDRPCRPRWAARSRRRTGDRELRDQGGAGSGNREAGLAVVPHGGRLNRGRGPNACAQATAACTFLASAASAPAHLAPGELEHRGRGVEVGGGAPCHDPIPAPTTDTQAPKTGFSTGVLETFFANLFGPSRGPRFVVSTSSTTEGRGLDAHHVRGARSWSRQAGPPTVAARPARVCVVSTGSTTEGCRSTTRVAWSRRLEGCRSTTDGCRSTNEDLSCPISR